MTPTVRSMVVASLAVLVAGGFCGPAARAQVGVLYAPSWWDNPAFRSTLSVLFAGAPVDYWDARVSIPPVSVMAQYDVVLTFVEYPYADPVLMGDRLADYVDQGGRAILGPWCYPHGQPNYLQGRIMTAAYCPAVIVSGGGDYNHDGTDCVHGGYGGEIDYASEEVVDELQPWAQCDGTVGSEGKSAVAWRSDRRVYYSGAHETYGMVPCLELAVGMCWCPAPASGACCDLDTGVCLDTSPAACDDTFYAMFCADLDPPCGPGGGVSVLYAPSNPDNPAFRSALAALVGGPVDYLDTRVVTPTLEQLLQYGCVFTWNNYAYADKMAFGDVLADYVDAGGRVILGQWAYSGFDTGGEFWGRILDWEYCPVSCSTWTGESSYAGDGQDCVHVGVTAYESSYVDIAALRPAALSDGTFTTDSPAVAWRPDRRVYYSPGNTGGEFGAGDWVTLTANMCTCPAAASTGDLNCDGAVNGYDIDPFVLALIDPAAYGEQFADCDYMLADCNQDGAVNAYDIDPFVGLLTGDK